MNASRASLSIIIPVGPDDRIDPGLFEFLERTADECEVIVSTVESAVQALPAGATPTTGASGRGRQVNRAAAAAAGDWLWLLHADSRPQPDALTAVFDFIGQAQAALGYGRLKFLDDGPWLTRFNAMGAAIRCRLLKLPYGDQGLCLPSGWFRRLNGFREDLVRGEDLDFVVRARDAGLPVRPMPLTVWTSARRYRDQGWLKTTWQHQIASIRLVRNARRSTESNPE